MKRTPSWWMWLASLVLHAALLLGLALGIGSPLALLSALPLLLPVVGLVRGTRYTYAWTSMMLVFYCAILLSNGYMAQATRTLMLVLATVAAFEFAALVLYVRFKARELTWAASSVPPAQTAD